MNSIFEKADWLMSRYAPSLVLVRKMTPVQSWYNGDEPWDQPTRIQWYICDGLSTLLHELGHHVLRHHVYQPPWRQKVMEEVEAWLWAEKTARKEKILFDYGVAEKSFTHYFTSVKKQQMVSIVWRWRNGGQENGNGQK